MGIKLCYVSASTYVSRQQNNNLFSNACTYVYSDKEIYSMDPWTKLLIAFDCESLSTALIILLRIVLSCANAHPCARTHLSILTGIWFFKVTAHHTKFLRTESKVGPLTQCDYSIICSLIHTILHLQDIWTLQATNIVEAQWQVYKSVRFLTFLHCRAGVDKAQVKWQCRVVRYPGLVVFASGSMLAWE